MSFSDILKQRIETKYRARGDNLGWRLLYSPARVLDGARVAFIGQNPGGNCDREDHAKFAMQVGSAYSTEMWHDSIEPGGSPLQQQVLAVFSWIGEKPEHILAGNLVPFRSPTWDSLKAKDDALAFGEEIWGDILARAKPSLVIGMGLKAQKSIQRILKVTQIEKILVNWGVIAGTRGHFAGGDYIGLPVLSRFKIMNRVESQAGIERLLGPCSRDLP